MNMQNQQKEGFNPGNICNSVTLSEFNKDLLETKFSDADNNVFAYINKFSWLIINDKNPDILAPLELAEAC